MSDKKSAIGGYVVLLGVISPFILMGASMCDGPDAPKPQANSTVWETTPQEKAKADGAAEKMSREYNFDGELLETYTGSWGVADNYGSADDGDKAFIQKIGWKACKAIKAGMSYDDAAEMVSESLKSINHNSDAVRLDDAKAVVDAANFRLCKTTDLAGYPLQ